MPSATAMAQTAPTLCAAIALAVGAAVLIVGWGLDVRAVRAFPFGSVSMKQSTAEMFVLCGAGLLLLVGRPTRGRRLASAACALLAVAFALAFLSEYAFGWRLGIDELPVRDVEARIEGARFPGRLAPMTAIAFLLTGVALLTLDARRRVSELLMAAVTAIAALCLIGYLYEIPQLYGTWTAKMAPHTGVVFLLLAFGIALSRRRARLAALIASPEPADVLLRRLIPIVAVVPLLLGWLHLHAETSGTFEPRMGTWFLTAATILCFVVVTVVATRSLDRGVRTAREGFATAFRHGPVGMALVSLDGRWLQVNDALCAITGRREHELIGTSLSDLVAGGTEQEISYSRADGRVVALQVSTSLVSDAEGRPSHLIAHVQDVTEQRELEGMKEEFVSLVTHELRTPLTSVSGYLALLAEDAEITPLTDDQRHWIEVATRNTERLVALVEDLLLVRRLESGSEQLASARVDFDALLRDRLESIAPAARAKRLSVKYRPTPSRCEVVGDDGRLTQVVDNLLSNAVKYTPPGGSVVVAVENGGSTVRLSISDSGIGIPRGEQERLFDPFFRASNAMSSVIPGTGLGLVVTKRLVEAQSGSIEVESVEGEGSTFTVVLPAHRG
jgi:signal transduction histidine kinase